MTEFKYGNVTLDTSKLPQASLDAMLRRGLSHFLGNEQSSKVSAFFDGKEGVTDEAKASKKAEFQEAAVAALMAGTVGNSVRGPRGTAVETIARQLAEQEVKDVLTANGITMPTGKNKVKFSDGQEFTKAELIERRLAKHGERLTKEAEAEVKARAKKAEKAGGLEALI